MWELSFLQICLWVVLTSCLCFPFGCLLFLFRVVCISACLLVCAETLYVCLISAYYSPSGLADRNALEVTSTCPACLLVSVLSVCLSPCAILACLLVLFLYLYHAIPCNPMQYQWKSLKPCNTIKLYWIPSNTIQYHPIQYNTLYTRSPPQVRAIKLCIGEKGPQIWAVFFLWCLP